MINFDSSDEDDPFSVSSFKIPKQARSNELLQPQAVGSSDYKHLCQLVAASLKLAAAVGGGGGSCCFKHSAVYTVNNEQIEQRYATRKSEMKKNSSKKSLPSSADETAPSEMFAFLRFASLENASAVCRDGLTVGNVSASPLANASMGVTLFRHADVLTPVAPLPGETWWLLVCKIFPGRMRKISPCPPDNRVDPDPNLDCYTSAEYNQPQSSYPSLYNNSQLYLFEYDLDSYEIVTRPRHVLPYALLDCKLSCPLSMPVVATSPPQIAVQTANSPSANATSQPTITATTTTTSDQPVKSQPTKRPHHSSHKMDTIVPESLPSSGVPPLKRSLTSTSAPHSASMTLPSHLMIPLGRANSSRKNENNNNKSSKGRPSL